MRPSVIVAIVINSEISHHLSHTISEHNRLGYDGLWPNFIDDASSSIDEQSILIPLRTSAIFPRHRTQVAELRMAFASDMVTAQHEFNDGVTTRACLPAFFPCECFE